MDDEGKRLLTALVEAIKNQDIESIDKLKYDNLFYGSNSLDVIVNYIWLSHNIVDFDFGYQIIKKGTKLFRIRKFEEGIDFSDLSQWNYPPNMPENRANKQGEAALYLGTTENVCLLETHVKNSEKYVLGEYEVLEDIKLGGFLDCENRHKKSRLYASIILNAYLIAPSRGEKNKELFEYLDNKYQELTINNLQINEVEKLDLPLKFGIINKKEEFYKTTNNLIEPLKKKYPDGLSYSSCFIPLATIGIVCSDHNIVLYKAGMKKIKLNKWCVKRNNNDYSGLDILKLLTSHKDA